MSSHKRFPPNELVKFLRVVDECLEAKASMTLIGGGAVALAATEKDGRKVPSGPEIFWMASGMTCPLGGRVSGMRRPPKGGFLDVVNSLSSFSPYEAA